MVESVPGGLVSKADHGRPTFPGYQVVREIHRGGQGVVYQALQTATQRHVAIKVMRDGHLAGPAELARFDREVQLMAQLDHPNVVGILDRGMAGGLPFLVMDYIRGLPLDAHLARLGGEVRPAVRLIAGIASAVGAAHVRGIIHRDLKPSNIRIDERGEPHILDFGLARSLWGDDGALQGSAAPTITGQFIGSTPWASPEQARGGGTGSRIDTRTDVYSLGVILFQSLTGRFPYSVEGPIREVLDRIIAAEPLRPSALNTAINDELQTIILKCLAKEPERRYQSAGELAADLGRYLAGEPIDAKRDSASYVLRKQLRRHRVLVGFTASIALLLTGGMATSLVLWRSSERNRKQAEQHLESATAAQKEASLQAAEAKREATRASRVVDLLGSVFRQFDPKYGGDRTLSASDMLRGGADRVLERLNGDPRIRADFLTALGDIHLGLGEYDLARERLAEALSLYERDPIATRDGVIIAVNRLGTLEKSAGNLIQAEKHFRRAYELTKAQLGPSNWHSLEALILLLLAENKSAEAEELLRVGLDRMREFYPGVPDAAHPMPIGELVLRITWSNKLAGIMEEAGRLSEAVPIMRETLHLADAAPAYMVDMSWAIRNNLAWLLTNTGEHAEAIALAEASLAARQKKLPPDHLDVASSMIVLGTARMRSGDLVAAEPLLREGLRIRVAKLDAHDDRVHQAQALLEEYQSRPAATSPPAK